MQNGGYGFPRISLLGIPLNRGSWGSLSKKISVEFNEVVAVAGPRVRGCTQIPRGIERRLETNLVAVFLRFHLGHIS